MRTDYKIEEKLSSAIELSGPRNDTRHTELYSLHTKARTGRKSQEKLAVGTIRRECTSFSSLLPFRYL
ncbi:hypothetical protein HOLleu_07197 [Holothuria leucospilota]|uniref:Uncharacterized protein n=1 Tax=Holothuria leucospilota TaxID=206669 RepID=A0A9Q1HFG2_HOLLE|nr:hypothetical protein HOLleu_07197 [Holothuria leucospilota]